MDKHSDPFYRQIWVTRSGGNPWASAYFHPKGGLPNVEKKAYVAVEYLDELIKKFEARLKDERPHWAVAAGDLIDQFRGLVAELK